MTIERSVKSEEQFNELYRVRKQKVQLEEVIIISCCDCGMQFVLYGALVEESGNINLIDQIKINYCPYCGKKQI